MILPTRLLVTKRNHRVQSCRAARLVNLGALVGQPPFLCARFLFGQDTDRLSFHRILANIQQ